mgnify:CR=1 FL=1
MPEQTYSIDEDLKEARAMAQSLEDYVRGSELYGRAGGGFFSFSRMASLTVGALLMRLRRLRAFWEQLTPEQREILQAAENQHEQTRREWRRHYDEKMVREAHSRLDAMQHFFEECRDDPKLCARVYLPEALRRTIVQELWHAIDEAGIPNNDLAAKMRRVDASLRRYTQSDDFLWDAQLQEVYPRDIYWWLYARPPQPERG